MGRTYQIDIVLDEHGAAQIIKQVDSELERLNARFKTGDISVQSYTDRLKILSAAETQAHTDAKRMTTAFAEMDAARMRVTKGQADQILSTNQASAAANAFGGTLRGLLGTFGVYMSAAGVLGAAKSTLEYASSLEKAKVSLDTTARGVQELENIAASSNTTLGAMTSSVLDLQRRLAGEDKSAAVAMQVLKLNTEEFLGLKGDQQFLIIARALGAMEDEIARNELAFQLFGRSYKEILPALVSDVDTLRDSVHMLTESQVRDVAKIEAQWKQLGLTVKRVLLDTLSARAEAERDMAAIARIANGGLPELPDSPGSVRSSPLLKDAFDAAAQGGRGPGFDPSTSAGLAYAEVIEKRLTASANERIEKTLEERKLRQEIVDIEADHLGKAFGLNAALLERLGTMKSIKAEEDGIIQAVQAELAARGQVLAAQGFSPDGRRMPTDPIGQMEHAQNEYARKLADLRNNNPGGVDTTFREQQLLNEFHAAFQKAAAAAVDMAGAHQKAAVAGGAAGAGLDRAAGGASGAASAFESFKGLLVGTPISTPGQTPAERMAGRGPWSTGQFLSASGMNQRNTLMSAPYGGMGTIVPAFEDGGPVTSDGPIFAHRDEFVVPKGGALVKEGGGGSVSITINAQGATFEDDRALDRLTDKIAARLGQRAGKSLR